ncbi:MAG: pantetheine-phosphate adenylyltransferase [Candidatus Norongarragalinales archaeon]
MKKFRLVATGGTFDRLHKGHEALLAKAFAVGERVLIGLTVQQMTRKKNYARIVQSFVERKAALKNFLKKKGWLKRARIYELHDVCGPTLQDGYQAIVCTSETVAGARLINRARRRRGLRPLKIVLCPLVLSEDRKHISSTRMRGGEEDRRGFLYRSLFKRTLKATPALRAFAKRPFGTLYPDAKRAGRAIRLYKPTKIILVGDVVARTLDHLDADVLVFDEKTRRGDPVLGIERVRGREIVCRNPRGTITRSLARSIERALRRGGKVFVRVIGEEDYAFIPAVLFAPLHSVVAYGQPRRGVVVCKVDESEKQRLAAFVKKLG